MANEWLTQLMAGLGGAFTGATQARERMAIEEERKRKLDEAMQQREMARNLFRGQPTTAQIGEYLGGGGDVTTASLAARLGIPEEAPKARTQYDPTRGVIIDVDTGKFTPIAGLPARTTTPSERPPSRTETGAGLVAYRRFLNDPALANNPTEKASRQQLVNDIRMQYRGITDAEIGRMLMRAGGSRSVPRPMEEDEWD